MTNNLLFHITLENKILLLSLLLLSVSFIGNAQEKDFEVWTSLGISKKVNKQLSFNLKEDVRFCDNSTRMKTNFTQLSANYRIKKFISVKMAYRFANKKEYDFSTSHQHLFLADIKVKQSYRRLGLSYRIRYQSKYTDIYSQENGEIPTSYLRHKWLIKYNIRGSRFSPYFSFELFQDMDYPERYLQKKQRFTIATSYETKRKNEITLFFTLQREVNQINPVQSGVLGVKYNYSL